MGLQPAAHQPMWTTRLYYAACGNICKLCIYYKNYAIYEKTLLPLTIIFPCEAYQPDQINRCGPLLWKGWRPLVCEWVFGKLHNPVNHQLFSECLYLGREGGCIVQSKWSVVCLVNTPRWYNCSTFLCRFGQIMKISFMEHNQQKGLWLVWSGLPPVSQPCWCWWS